MRQPHGFRPAVATATRRRSRTSAGHGLRPLLGALERVDCLHFEACYYQPIAWCIERGIAHFEGGAQGEHKMARALLPVVTPSAHWIAHPSFADAISRFLDREGEGMAGYLQELQAHSPLRQD